VKSYLHVSLCKSGNHIYHLPARHDIIPCKITTQPATRQPTSRHLLLVAWPSIAWQHWGKTSPPPLHCPVTWHWLTHTHSPTLVPTRLKTVYLIYAQIRASSLHQNRVGDSKSSRITNKTKGQSTTVNFSRWWLSLW